MFADAIVTRYGDTSIVSLSNVSAIAQSFASLSVEIEAISNVVAVIEIDIVGEKNREEFIEIINRSLTNPTGCWSDYNKQYKKWDMYRRSIIAGWPLMSLDELAAEPRVDDYPDLNC